MKMQSLIIYESPNLVQPYLVMAFEGWPDAGVEDFLRKRKGEE